MAIRVTGMRSQIMLLPRVMATCLLCGIAQTSTALASAKDMSEIKATSRALVEAQLRYDAPAVARLLAKDFVYVGNDGSLATKTEFLPTAEDRKRRPLQLLEWKPLEIRLYRETAVALYFIHEKSTQKGKPHEFRGRSLATWVKQNGRWLCAAIHD
jgi:uncharacterized protein (TIGR02246 family)